MTVFCDSFALIAWINVRDSHHQRVAEWFATYTGRIILTEGIILEFADGMSKPMFRTATVRLIERIRVDRQFEIIPHDSITYREGFALFAARPDKDWSLTDCISFSVMTQRGITDALTADQHFEQAGFRAIFKD